MGRINKAVPQLDLDKEVEIWSNEILIHSALPEVADYVTLSRYR